MFDEKMGCTHSLLLLLHYTVSGSCSFCLSFGACCAYEIQISWASVSAYQPNVPVVSPRNRYLCCEDPKVMGVESASKVGLFGGILRSLMKVPCVCRSQLDSVTDYDLLKDTLLLPDLTDCKSIR